MANDADPFGTPPPLGTDLVLLFIGALASGGGVLLVSKGIRQPSVA